MLLKYSLAHNEAARAVEKAVAEVLQDGLRTADIAADPAAAVGMAAMGDAIAAKLREAEHRVS